MRERLKALAAEGRVKEVRLFAIACARQVQQLMKSSRSIAALDGAEAFIRGELSAEEFTVLHRDAAKAAAKAAAEAADAAKAAATWAAEAAEAAAATWAATWAAAAADAADAAAAAAAAADATWAATWAAARKFQAALLDEILSKAEK